VIAVTGFLCIHRTLIWRSALAQRNDSLYRLGREVYQYCMVSSTLLTPRQAAEKLGISYPALKHWILAGRIRTVKTPGGHHRIPLSALSEFLPSESANRSVARISGRNQLLGSIVEVTVDGLLAKVVLAVGDQRVTAIITADAVRELDLKAGEPAVALIKATEVMIGRP
jgi:molybdopterin-binding protein